MTVFIEGGKGGGFLPGKNYYPIPDLITNPESNSSKSNQKEIDKMPEVYPVIKDRQTGLFRDMLPGETLAVYAREINYKNLVSQETVAIKKCTPVYLSADGQVKIASASAPATSKVRGLAMSQALPGETVPVIAGGSFVAAKQAWDEVLEGVDTTAPNYVPTGLTFGKDYFLSLQTGKLSTNPPGLASQSIVYIGTADGADTMEIDIESPYQIS